ncbi:MAG TPA: hypothetical protein DDW36_00445 [Candidatus Magasanikbacteria bacterium]|nr:hypothetical protein [Candidatus Magasanikbacteria bacterium]
MNVKQEDTEETVQRKDPLAQLRRRHGFADVVTGKAGASGWSKDVLARSSSARAQAAVARLNALGVPEQLDTRPLNSDGMIVVKGTNGVPDTLVTPGPYHVITYLEMANMRRREQGRSVLTMETVPRNAAIRDWLEQQYAMFGFRWEIVERMNVKNRTVRVLEEQHRPSIAGRTPTLADLILFAGDAAYQLFDGYDQLDALGTEVRSCIGQAVSFCDQLAVMNASGIGYKGYQGVSWLPGYGSFKLPVHFRNKLVALGNAVFLLYDAAAELFGKDPELTALLNHKRPERIPPIVCDGRVDIIRPDVVVVRDPDGTYRPVVTELESAPAGHGMTDVMHRGYDLPRGTLDEFVSYLCGRSYIVLATWQWSEYVFEQAAFIAALRQRGVDARIIFDRSLTYIHEQIQPRGDGDRKLGWHPPHPTDAWNTDFLGRIAATGFDSFVEGMSLDDLPRDVGNAVVFRFGYFDNFTRAELELMLAWQQAGATIMNALQFYTESKVLMAAVNIPAVRAWIRARDPSALAVLNDPERGFLAHTTLLREGPELQTLVDDQLLRLTKFAAWDGDNQCWGARSLAVGAQASQTQWAQQLHERARLPHPVVGQHCIRSAQFLVPYVDEHGVLRILGEARTRVTPFLLRNGTGEARLAGDPMITLRAGSFRIHGASDAVEMPLTFI